MTIVMKRCFSSVAKAARIVSCPDKLVYPSVPMHQFLLSGIEENLDAVVLTDGLTRQDVTGAQIAAQIGRMANKFKKMGMGKGDHVAIVGLNHLNYLPAKLGVVAAGGVPVLFNPLHNNQEMGKLMDISDCNYAIGHMCSSSKLNELKEEHNLNLLPNLEDLDNWCKDESTICPEYDGHIDDTALMMFSSGTTGLPKAVEISHKNMNSQLESINVSGKFKNILKEESVEHAAIVDFLPEFHTYGSLLAQFTVLNGFQRICLPFFSPELFLQCLQDYKAPCTTVVPPIMVMLSKLDIVPNYDLSHLRLLVVGAAPLAPETEQAVLDRLQECNPGINLEITQGYGCTETSGATLLCRANTNKTGSVGAVIAGQEIKLVNTETGETCGPHERGEIFIRGPQIMKGYYKNPAANAETFQDEWLKTGDIAYYDDDEDFYIVDRLKEFIKVKAYQVAPAELEAVLLTHEQIVDAAVIGIPSERTGEAPKAYVTLPYGATLTEDDVKEFVASQVSDYKRLAEVEFVKTIPKLTSGKIQRRLLREKHEKDSQNK